MDVLLDQPAKCVGRRYWQTEGGRLHLRGRFAFMLLMGRLCDLSSATLTMRLQLWCSQNAGVDVAALRNGRVSSILDR